MGERESGPPSVGGLGRWGLLVGAAVVAGGLVAVFVDPQAIGGMGRRMAPPRGVGFESSLRLFLSTYNVVLLLALTWSYGVVYRDLPNRFTGSLLTFAVALLLYAMASNPAIHVLFGFHGGPELGPFLFLPDLFAAVAVTVLLYQSFQ